MSNERIAIKFLKKWPGTGYNAHDICVKSADIALPLISSGVAVRLGDNVERAVAGGEAERRGGRGNRG